MDETERIAVLEAEIRHITRKLDTVSDKVDEIHGVMLQAKGARWFILASAAVAGFMAANFPTIAKFLGLIR